MSNGAGASNGPRGPQRRPDQGCNFDKEVRNATTLPNPFPVDGRWRDLFPLPEMRQKAGPSGGHATSVHAKRRYRRRVENIHHANSLISTLNAMNGFSNPSSSKITQSQQAAHQQILQQIVNSPRSDKPVQVREAVHELLHMDPSSYVEDEVRSTVRSYCRELVSLPETGAKVFEAGDLLDETGREILQDPQGHLFQQVSQSTKVKPYMDEVLRADENIYHGFIVDLWHRGMLTFGRVKRADITPFFVAKKDGRLRLVLDCRATNQLFKDPPEIAMAAGYSFGQLVLDHPQQVYTAQSDIKDYFYSIGLPDYLFPFFSLPPIRPGRLQQMASEKGLFIEELRGSGESDVFYPQMRVVPMGWSWAMYFAQRIHQHQVMLGTGAKPEQILADGRPVPSLSSGVPIIVPYADNLNVIGTDKIAVQVTKDAAVARLREVGFRVHEEVDATLKAKALGFFIDGTHGIIHAKPEKRDKIISVLRWLGSRPRVSGKALERIIGHCIHIMMLRREFLSVFRSVYDFKTATYHRPTKLWRTAADECRWAADLLFICQSELWKPWDNVLTVSDACLSGTAVCSLHTPDGTAHSLGQQRELWRYRSVQPASRAREFVQKLDPFRDVETVLDLSSGLDPFQLNAEFQNVPCDLANSPDWKPQFSCRMHKKEHITLLEGRATIQAIRHLARSSGNFGKRHVHLGDNLGMVLAFDRGRAKVFPLLVCCRRAAAYGVAMGCQFFHRWIPSEWNAADGPSRKWEKQDSSPQSQSSRFKKKIIDNLIYPRNHKAFGSDSRLEGCCKQRIAASTKGEDVSDTYGHAGEECGRANCQESQLVFNQSSSSKVQWTDKARRTGCISSDLLRLSAANHDFSRVLQSSAPSNHHRWSGRCCSRRVPQRCFRGGVGPIRGSEVLCSSPRQLSPSRKVWAHQKQTSFERMAECRPWPSKDAPSMAFDQSNRPASLAAQAPQSSPLYSHNVCGISQTSRGSQADEPGCNPIQPVESNLGIESQPIGNLRPQQGRFERRVHAPGLSRGAFSRPSVDENQGRNPFSAPLSTQLCRSPEALEDRSDFSWTKRRLCSSSPTPSLRCQLGSPKEVQVSSRDKAAREVGVRLKPEKVRESCPCCSTLRQVASGNQAPSGGIAKIVEGNGYRIFVPVNPNGKKPALELFAGCAAWSKAMCEFGFTVHAYDVVWGSGGNVLSPKVFQKLLCSIKRKCFCYVHFGMPCDSWSLARKWDGGPRPLRDNTTFLYGYDDLLPFENQKVETGNNLLKATVALAQTCMRSQTPGSIENPLASRAWLTKEMKLLMSLGAVFQHVDYCQYGKAWKKATSFLCWSSPDFHFQRCSGFQALCSATKGRHILLHGQFANGTFKTHKAQPYPTALVHSIASHLSLHL